MSNGAKGGMAYVALVVMVSLISQAEAKRMKPWFVGVGISIHNSTQWDAGQQCDVQLMHHMLLNVPSVPSIVCRSTIQDDGTWVWNYTMVLANHQKQLWDYIEDLHSSMDEAFLLLEDEVNLTVTHTNASNLTVSCDYSKEYYDMTGRDCVRRQECGEEVEPGVPKLWESTYTSSSEETRLKRAPSY